MKQKLIKHLGSVNTHSHTHIGICMCRLNNNNNCKKNNNNTPSRASLVVRFISSNSSCLPVVFSIHDCMPVCLCVCQYVYVCLPKDFNRRKLLQVVHPIFMAPNVAYNKTFPGPNKPDQLGHVYIQHRLVGGGCGRVHRA